VAQDPRYEEQAQLTAKQSESFREVLQGRRAKILGEVEETLDTVLTEGLQRHADEVDQATAATSDALDRRMRDREKGLLKKIDRALKRMEEGEYDECESCGNYIGLKRLTARPEATLCIECKEEQERHERKYMDSRETAPDTSQFPFK